jgi:hypothetical protein
MLIRQGTKPLKTKSCQVCPGPVMLHYLLLQVMILATQSAGYADEMFGFQKVRREHVQRF